MFDRGLTSLFYLTGNISAHLPHGMQQVYEPHRSTPGPNCPFEVLGCQMTARAISRTRAETSERALKVFKPRLLSAGPAAHGDTGNERRRRRCLLRKVVKGCRGECDRLVRRNVSHLRPPSFITNTHSHIESKLDLEDVQLNFCKYLVHFLVDFCYQMLKSLAHALLLVM